MNWLVGPSTQPSTLGDNLIAHNFTHMGEVPGMAVDLWKINEHLKNPPGLKIEHIKDADSLKTWCQIGYANAGMPDFVTEAFLDFHTQVGLGKNLPMYYYLGWQNSKPVAGAMLFLGAGVAGIYNVATIAEVRRQGIGSAMTLAALLEARTLGYRIAVLESSEMGTNVYHRLGFQEYCKINLYLWSDLEQA